MGATPHKVYSLPYSTPRTTHSPNHLNIKQLPTKKGLSYPHNSLAYQRAMFNFSPPLMILSYENTLLIGIKLMSLKARFVQVHH